MVDWIVQVLRALKVSTDQTFFLAISIMDRYFAQKSRDGTQLLRSQVHLIGLVAVFISSKFEDVDPLCMQNVLVDAGHSKYSAHEIREMELDILRTLEYKIQVQSSSLHELVFIKLKTFLF